MGNITARKRLDGTTAYKAQVRIRRGGVIVYSQTETFDKKATAQTWIKKRETELSEPNAIEILNSPDPTLGEIINRYQSEIVRQSGRTKRMTLTALSKSEIGALRASQIKSSDIVSFARSRIMGGAKPPTVLNDLILLSGVFVVAIPAWGYRLSNQAMIEAKAVCSRLGFTAKAGQRSRRPSLDELDRLMSHFKDALKRRAWAVPMIKIVPFAIFSTRRLAEIARIRWDDIDHQEKRILVRKMKHPTKKEANDVWCKLPDPAYDIMMSMPRFDERIFPYTDIAIGAQFTRACQWLEIEGLVFHSLRHEGVSRLFEMDTPIVRAAEVSGHQDWGSLRRYSHLNGTGDKYENWKWLPIVIEHQIKKPRRNKSAGQRSRE